MHRKETSLRPPRSLLVDSAKVVILYEGMGEGNEVKCYIFLICEGANSFIAALLLVDSVKA